MDRGRRLGIFGYLLLGTAELRSPTVNISQTSAPPAKYRVSVRPNHGP